MLKTTAAFLTILSMAATGAAAEELPREVSARVPPGTTAIDLAQGDITGDGRNDYLLVVEKSNGDRALLLLVRRKNGDLTVAARNDTIIGCHICLGEGGDYDVSATGDGFEVSDTSGSGDVSATVTFRFVYARSRKTWVLKEFDKAYDDAQTQPEEHKRTTVSRCSTTT